MVAFAVFLAILAIGLIALRQESKPTRADNLDYQALLDRLDVLADDARELGAGGDRHLAIQVLDELRTTRRVIAARHLQARTSTVSAITSTDA